MDIKDLTSVKYFNQKLKDIKQKESKLPKSELKRRKGIECSSNDNLIELPTKYGALELGLSTDQEHVVLQYPPGFPIMLRMKLGVLNTFDVSVLEQKRLLNELTHIVEDFTSGSLINQRLITS